MHACMLAKSFQSCLTLCNPMDCRPPGSSVHGILQAGILEWVAMPYSRGSSWSIDQIWVSYVSYIDRQVFFKPTKPSGKPHNDGIPRNKRLRTCVLPVVSEGSESTPCLPPAWVLQKCSWWLLPFLNQCWSHMSRKSSLKKQARLGHPPFVCSAIRVHHQHIYYQLPCQSPPRLLGGHFLACSTYFCMFVDVKLSFESKKRSITTSKVLLFYICC